MTLLVLLKLLAILILLFLSAISSGSETALTAVSKLQAHRQNEKGIKDANYILKIKEFKDEFKPGPHNGIDFKQLVNAIAFKNTPEDDTTKLPS